MKRTKKFKKIISAILVATIALTSSFTALADDSQRMQEVLLSVKERIGDTSEYKNFESHISQNANGTSYSFYWNSDSKSLNVTASESGLILDYYYSDGSSSYSDKPNFNQITVTDAAQRTKDLIAKLNPQIADKIQVISDGITQDLYRNGFSFSMKRYENGIEVKNNNGYVRVNGDATVIKSFNISYDETLAFPVPDSIMSVEEAQKIYGEKIGMVLEYRVNYDYENKTRTVIPVFIPETSEKYINAVTGEITEFVYEDVYFGKESLLADAAGSGGGTNSAMREEASLSDAEKSEFENLDGLKSKDELINIIKTNPYTKVTDGMTLRWYNTSKSRYEDTYTASLSFEKTDGEYKYLNIAVNMKTGEIISFYKGSDIADSAKSKELTTAEIKSKQEKALKDLANDKANEYKYDENAKNFVRYANGIPFRNDTVTINVSKITGEIISYRISYSNVEFPALQEVIAKNAALKCLFASVPYNVYYAKMATSDTDAKLIYVLDENMPTTIDAFTGKLLGYSNEEYVSKIFTGYTDISGHYAENQINTLAKFGIRFEGTEFKPNEAITEKDFIALLVSTFKNRNSVILKATETYANEYATAYRENIITPEEANPNGILTRELAAKYLIRAMGVEEIANLPNIYVAPFNDVVNYKGHIAILNGLNIVKGDGNGNFNPTATLTRADAIMLIYNYLAR